MHTYYNTSTIDTLNHSLVEHSIRGNGRRRESKEGKDSSTTLPYELLDWSPDPSKKYYMRLLYVLSNKINDSASYIYTATNYK